MQYGLSQLVPSFPHAKLFAVPRTFVNTKSPGTNGLSFTLASYLFFLQVSHSEAPSSPHTWVFSGQSGFASSA